MEKKRITITAKEKSGLWHTGRRTGFTVTDTEGNKYYCFNSFLHSQIPIDGHCVDIQVIGGRYTTIKKVISPTIFNDDNSISKPPANVSERQFFQMMTDAGWQLTKKGWPDFACFKDGKLILIEVKPKRSHRLKSWQQKLMMQLVKHGIRCYRWSPNGGFLPVLDSVKFPIDLP